MVAKKTEMPSNYFEVIIIIIRTIIFVVDSFTVVVKINLIVN